MKNKAIIAASLAAAVSLATVGAVFAQTSTSPNALTIGVDGQTKLVGTISSISGNSWVVTSWGGSWTVNVASANVASDKDNDADNTSTTVLADFKAGDSVAVKGTAVSGSLSITASSVALVNKDTVSDHKGFFMGLFGKIGLAMHNFFAGTVSNVNTSANTFTLTGKHGQSVTVDVNASTTVRVGTTTATGSIANLVNGMRAIVVGKADANASGTINAAKVGATDSTNVHGSLFGGLFGGWKHGK